MELEETVWRQAWEALLPMVAVVGPLPGSGRASKARPVQLDGQVAVVLSTLRTYLWERRVSAAWATRAGTLMEMAFPRRRKPLVVVGGLAVPVSRPKRVTEETGVKVLRVSLQEERSITQVAAGVGSELMRREFLDLGSLVVAAAV